MSKEAGCDKVGKLAKHKMWVFSTITSKQRAADKKIRMVFFFFLV